MRFLVFFLALALAACGASPPSADSQAALSARPLKLPALQPNSTCSISPMQNFASPPGQKLPGYGFGPGPVFLSGQTEWHSGQYALIMVSPDYSGPVVVRGHQLDGTNGMPFRAQQGNGNVSISPGSPGQWRSWNDFISGAPGCYGLQVDGVTFSEVIVFNIIGGPPPPA